MCPALASQVDEIERVERSTKSREHTLMKGLHARVCVDGELMADQGACSAVQSEMFGSVAKVPARHCVVFAMI